MRAVLALVVIELHAPPVSQAVLMPAPPLWREQTQQRPGVGAIDSTGARCPSDARLMGAEPRQPYHEREKRSAYAHVRAPTPHASSLSTDRQGHERNHGARMAGSASRGGEVGRVRAGACAGVPLTPP